MSTRLVICESTGSVVERLASPRTELKAGGTDVIERVHRRVDAPDELVHLARSIDETALNGVSLDVSGQVRIGALTTLATLASDAIVVRRHPLLAAASAASATPQIRALATVGGALMQRVRCWYYRHPALTCLRRGGDTCLAREGENDHHAIFDQGSCIAVHPSTIGAALLALDASLVVHMPGAPTPVVVPMGQFFDVNVWNATDDNTLVDGALIEAVLIDSVPARRQRYLRASARALADWASVEVAAVVEVAGGRVRHARIVLGGVARAPRRAFAAERALIGHPFDAERIALAARAATSGAKALSKNAYKIPLVENTVRAALEELVYAE
jgi:xanthine dehydrogenase YagS FAD-binding subunit